MARRFWWDGPLSASESREVELVGEPFHHIVQVCKISVGERFELLGAWPDCSALCELTHINKKNAVAKIIAFVQRPPVKAPLIHLCLSIPRLPILESIIEKAVEMGVYKIWPFTSDRSFLRATNQLSSDRYHRWQKIVQSASAQTGRADPLLIHPALSLENLFAEMNPYASRLCLFAYEGGPGDALKSALTQSTWPQNVFIFVGSEGGFSTREKELFLDQGLNPISLGAQILRVETACLTMLAVLKYELGHWQSEVQDEQRPV